MQKHRVRCYQAAKIVENRLQSITIAWSQNRFGLLNFSLGSGDCDYGTMRLWVVRMLQPSDCPKKEVVGSFLAFAIVVSTDDDDDDDACKNGGVAVIIAIIGLIMIQDHYVIISYYHISCIIAILCYYCFSCSSLSPIYLVRAISTLVYILKSHLR